MRRLSRRLVLPMGKSPRSAACVVCVLVLVVGLAAGESPGGTATVFHIQTATPSQQLAERYVSVTIDASNCQRGFAPLNEPSVSYKAQVLGKALSPAVLRIGGTSGDALTCACPVCGRVCVWPCVCVAVCVCVCVWAHVSPGRRLLNTIPEPEPDWTLLGFVIGLLGVAVIGVVLANRLSNRRVD